MLLDGLTEEERKVVEQAGLSRKYKRGQPIVVEGDTTRSLCLIQKGAVEIKKRLISTKYKHLKDVGEGDFFGEMAFLGVEPRTASVVATKECQVLELTADNLEELASSRPGIAAKVYRNIAMGLARRLKQSTDELKEAVLWAIQGMGT